MKTSVKHLFIVICAAILIFPFSVGDAAISSDQVALETITLKSSMDDVFRVFGQPQYVENETTYCWGRNSLKIYTWSPARGKTNHPTHIVCAENNGFETPAGVIVGMPDTVLNTTYGEADRVVDSDRNGNTVYCYSSKGGDWLVFRVKNGVIRVIELMDNFS